MKTRHLLLLLAVLLSWNSWAQTDSLSTKSIYVGLRNNEYACIGFQSGSWSVGLENTLWARTPKEQYIRATGGYRLNTGVWNVIFSADAFAGVNYAGRFYDGSLKVGLDKTLGRFSFGAGAMALYDSEMGYNTCYTVHAGCRIIQEASIVVNFTNIPEYRMPEHRIVPGLLFRARKLWVRPELSIPLNDNIQFTRVLLSFRYDFLLKSPK